MTAIIVILLLAFPALCWWGWFHHWKKNKNLIQENETLKNALSELSINQKKSDQKTILANSQIHDLQLSYQLKENSLRDSLSKKDNELSKSLEKIRILERTVFYFKKEASEEFVSKIESLTNDISQYSKDCQEAEAIKQEEERKVRRAAFLLQQEEDNKLIAEKEKEELKEKILEKQRKRELEKQITQQLIDEGELFPEANKRPPIPKEIVDTLWNRDKGQCVYCGASENIHIDHIVPFSKGGATCLENLQLLCQKCNLQKSDKIG